MKALSCTDSGVALADVPRPEPAPGEVIVDVRSAGICNTDLELARGYMSFRGVLGHEVIGLHEGKRVALEINCACGRCGTCRAGGRNHCPIRTVLGILGRDGGIAEAVRI